MPTTDQHCLRPHLTKLGPAVVNEKRIFVNEMFGLLRSLLEHSAGI